MQESLYKIPLYLCLFSSFVLILFYVYTQQEVWCSQAPKAKFRWERWQHADCLAGTRGLLVANKELLPVIAFWDATNDLLEYEWVFNVLLARVERPIFIVRSEAELEAASHGFDKLNLLYITSEYRKFRPTSFFDDDGLKRLRQKWGQRLWLGYMHLSDEHLDSVKGYDVANYVYRNYWNWELEESIREIIRTTNPGLKVEWMILGFANIRPFSPGLLLPASMRSIVCNFYGSPNRGNRPQLAAALAKEPGILKAPSGEQIKCDIGAANLDQRDYWERLQRSVFTLCPSGNGDETYRLAETLTNGGIPITVATYYSRRFLSEAPIFQLESWDNINKFITHQLALAHANATYLDGLQADVAKWWHNYMAQLQSQIAADVVREA